MKRKLNFSAMTVKNKLMFSMHYLEILFFIGLKKMKF
jgi:hypothetical protein